MTDAPTEREGEGAWAKLRRRKVVQWGVAYVAGAWGLLQGIGFAADAFSWPSAIKQIALLLLLIGLPIALVLAWYHGDKGQQRVGRAELAILTALFLLGGGLFWRYQHVSETPSVATSPASNERAAAIPADHSIAVLPFVNMSPDQQQDYFADGISEELLNLLAQVPQLRVIARTSSFSFKGKEVDIATIARTLNVANVLEGSVRRSGEKLRVTAQLVRATDSSHLWSQTYDRQMSDVFAMQDEIAAAVVAELKIKLLGRLPTTHATDPKAYALFLQAREISRQYTKAAYTQSISLYQQALALDPTYTAAWVGLAGTYGSQVDYGQRVPDEGYRLAREATAKALALDPENADAHSVLAGIAIDDRDLADAAQHLQHAFALDPANPDIIGNAAFFLRRLGRLDEAIALGKYQIARDPVNSDGHDALGYAYRYAGHLDEALAEYRSALSLSPNRIAGHEAIGEVLLQQGDARAALDEMQQEPDEANRLTGLSMVQYALGHKAESDAALGDLVRRYEASAAYSIATVFAYRGEADQAYHWLDKAAEYHDPVLGSVAIYPMFAKIHTDRRWLTFLRKLGFAPEQLAAIKFEVTVPK